MDVDWPELSGDHLICLKKFFTSAVHLDAAFDTDEEAMELLESIFPDMVPEDAVDLVALLMVWKETVSRSIKRARHSTVSHARCFAVASTETVQSAYRDLTRTNVLTLIEQHTKRRQRILRLEAESRAKRLDAERQKYSLLLSQIIIDAELPVVALIQTLDDPRQGWLHLFGTRRCNTLKNRYKSWRPFAVWLELHRGRKFPLSLRDIIDYVQHRVDEGCGKTIPESFHISLALIEQLGRVPEGERLSGEELWKSRIKSWTAELAAESPPAKTAEMYTVAMLISLELRVVNEELPIFTRALVWVTLVMVWGSMRCDDMQAALPHRTTLSNYGLRLVLGRSKTSGPDKVQKEVSVHVYRTSSLTGEDWRKFVPPSGLSSLIQKLLANLPVPRRIIGGWDANAGMLLLPDGLEGHFTGHSPRNFMTSVAAAIGFHRDQRAYLGRWAMGMVSSEEYVRTARQVVFSIQKAVNRSIVTGMDQEYFEDEAIERLCRAAEASGANPNRIKKRHVVMSSLPGRHCLGGVFPTLDVRADDWAVLEPADLDETAVASSILEQQSKEVSADKSTPRFFVTISRRTAFRRLHLTGCYVKPSNCAEVRFMEDVDSGDFDAICRSCKRKMLSEGGKDPDPESSSTASSSSTESAGGQVALALD
eukprot:s4486_g7.t1